ncbi:MAG: hypothetical protein IJ828_02500, partial [Treponema sp.]|nr:hypothetical protein [Treponema sp.]
MKVITANEISKPSVTKRALALFIALTYLSCLAPTVVYAEAGNSGAPQPSGSQLYAANLISAEEGGEVRLG